ncbi:MAG: polysaccharide deacetylase family protein [Patescibacteria group bacterium]|jgi:peptidoglycan/xylan/chitin deacetylase (PgdA/CDA1 family)
MKTIIRNIIIILSYLTTIPFWRRILLTKPLVRVWCLHNVKDNEVAYFEEKVVWLKNNFNVITPQQFLNKELANDKINVLITFDDGYQSWLNLVLPILKKHSLKAVFFINQPFRCHEAKLLSDGHTLGGHSVSHPRLTKLSPEQLSAEINKSVNSAFFAYPFGDKQSYNPVVINEVKKAGYKFGFTILPGYNNSNTNPYLLHRDSLDVGTPMLIFKLWFKGSYDLWKKWF